MNGPEVLDVLREMSIFILKLSAPMVLTALLLGVVVSLFQAITQIQEATLTFVPKLIGVVLVGLWVLPQVLPSFGVFAQTLFSKITASG